MPNRNYLWEKKKIPNSPVHITPPEHVTYHSVEEEPVCLKWEIFSCVWGRKYIRIYIQSNETAERSLSLGFCVMEICCPRGLVENWAVFNWGRAGGAQMGSSNSNNRLWWTWLAMKYGFGMKTQIRKLYKTKIVSGTNAPETYTCARLHRETEGCDTLA